MVNNNYLTASDLYEYLKAYVEIFNSDELPKPTDIVEVTSKTADLIQVNKLKVNSISIEFIFIQLYSSVNYF
jgi:hypothetical protein